jgi:hypothetical protein
VLQERLSSFLREQSREGQPQEDRPLSAIYIYIYIYIYMSLNPNNYQLLRMYWPGGPRESERESSLISFQRTT